MRRLACILILLGLHVAVAGALPEPFSAVVSPEVRSAYQARSLIIEDRPVAILPIYLYAKTLDFGTFGVWNRTLTSLTDRKESLKSQAFYERDWALRWRYELSLTEDVTLRTTVDKVWMTFWNYRAPARGTRDHTLNEWRLREELRTPWLAPFCYIRRGLAPTEIFYTQLGASHEFALGDGVALAPQAYVEMGNAGLERTRFGARTDGHGWRGGVQTLNFRLDLSWTLSEALMLYAGLHQFITINEPVRHCVKAKTSAWSRRDLTIWSVGFRYRF